MTRLLSPILRGGLLCAFAFGATACSDGNGFGSRESGEGTLKPNDMTQQGEDQFKKDAEGTTGTAGTQGEGKKFDTEVVGFYAIKDDPSKQLVAYHYCDKMPDGMMQCVLYDDNTSDAKMIGQESIITKDKYEALPEEEKSLWHPHNFEILSGQLAVPGMSDEQEMPLMTELMNTYGKTYLFETEGGDMPKGEPKLAWSITKEGELKQELVDERDQKLGIDTKKKLEARQSLQALADTEGASDSAHSVMGEGDQSATNQSQQQQQSDEPVKGDETAAPVKGQEDTGDETAAPVKGQEDTGDETAAPTKGQQDSGDETAAPTKGQQSDDAGGDADYAQDTSDKGSQIKGDASVKSAK